MSRKPERPGHKPGRLKNKLRDDSPRSDAAGALDARVPLAGDNRASRRASGISGLGPARRERMRRARVACRGRRGGCGRHCRSHMRESGSQVCDRPGMVPLTFCGYRVSTQRSQYTSPHAPGRHPAPRRPGRVTCCSARTGGRYSPISASPGWKETRSAAVRQEADSGVGGLPAARVGLGLVVAGDPQACAGQQHVVSALATAAAVIPGGAR